MFTSVIIAALFFLTNLVSLAASKGDLEKVTSKVYFDIDIGGKASGR